MSRQPFHATIILVAAAWLSAAPALAGDVGGGQGLTIGIGTPDWSAVGTAAKDRSQRYTQFVQMSTELMNELQNTERELVDGLQTMKRGATADQFDSQINSMMNNNLMLLGLQSKIQNLSQTTRLMGNIAKTDSDAKLNSIRNLRD